MADAGEVTQLLLKVRQGDAAAREQLARLVYPELRRLAGAIMRGERPDHTLQPTALVNEAYMRLAGANLTLQDRAHFFAAAAHLMHEILLDCARRHRAAKRSGNRRCVDMEDALLVAPANADLILDVDRAMRRLEQFDSRQYRIVELRFFGGLTEDEIAQVLRIAPRTVRRDWRMAKAWLQGALSEPVANDG